MALKPGDKVFFYVKDDMCLYGVFSVASEPYFCQDGLFNDPGEEYPLRFNFDVDRWFDNPIPVSELARLIEGGLLYSITTFERDQNAPFRGIRQITNQEGAMLGELLLKYNPKQDFGKKRSYSHPKLNARLELEELIDRVNQGTRLTKPHIAEFTRIPVANKSKWIYIAQYENSLQGYVYYSLRRGLSNVKQDIDVNNFTECLMEIPMLKAQQFRSDILCLYGNGQSGTHFYTIIEIKRDRRISIDDLSQLIGYMKTYSAAKGIPFDCIEGLYISNEFEQDAVDYLRNRKKVEKENPVRLIEYSTDSSGAVSFTKINI